MSDSRGADHHNVLFVSGHKAAGKTTASSILEGYGMTTYDTGPRIKQHVAGLMPDVPFQQALEAIIKDSGDEKYVEKFFLREYDQLLEHNDLTVVGYRNFDDLMEAWEKITYVGKISSPHVIYIESDFEHSVERYSQREGVRSKMEAEEILRRIWRREIETGLHTIKENATIVIENNASIEEFEESVGRFALRVIGVTSDRD